MFSICIANSEHPRGAIFVMTMTEVGNLEFTLIKRRASMRHAAKRLKKKKPLLTFTNIKLLHSFNRKSTYFYFNDGGFFRKTNYVLPVACSLALLLVMGLAINPMVSGDKEKAYAADNIPGEPGYGEDTTNASIELSVGNNNLSNAAAKAGEVNYVSTTVNVKATDVSGYKMYVQAAPGSSATLTNAGVTVDGVGSKVATADFGNNKWGYALDETGAGVESLAYSSVPENGSVLNPAYTTNAASEEKNFNLVFAAKFATDAPAGHYGTNVLLSVAVDAETVGGFYNIEYMQDMTTSICSQANENDTKQLIDKRDNKKYWVTKLRDGNCWMTQNLDLDLGTMTLTPDNTDVPRNWDAIKTQTGSSPSFSGSAGAGTNIVQSWDPGERLCTAAGCSTPTGEGYDTHYLVGNYYSWGAATAGQAASLTSTDTSIKEQATQSICPKNWTLPVNMAFTNMVSAYGDKDGGSYGGFVVSDNPFYFVFGGFINYDISGSTTSWKNAGTSGCYWYSTANVISTAYNAAVSGSGVSGGGSSTRFNGMSVRCVAR